MRRIIAFDIEGGIGFGIAKALRIREASLKGQALRFHARQDVIAGAVDNAEDTIDAIAGHRLAHRLDHRNAACNRGFKLSRTPFFSAISARATPCLARSALFAVTT